MNPWEQTCSSSASCSSKRATLAEAQLEVEDCAQGPAVEQAPTYTDAGKGQEGVDRKHANISNFPFSSHPLLLGGEETETSC